MGNSPIYVDIDAELKRHFLAKLAINGIKQKDIIKKWITEYTFGKKVPKQFKITPMISRRCKGVKVSGKF